MLTTARPFKAHLHDHLTVHMSNRDAWLLGLLAAIALFGGILQQLAVPAHALLLESGIPYGLMALEVIFAWYRRDAQQRGYRRSARLNLMIVAVAIIAVPYYLFRSRGLSRGVLATLVFLGIMVAYTGIQYGAQLLVYALQRRA